MRGEVVLESAESASVTWLWTANGWPWYVVFPIAAVVLYMVTRWSRAETKGLRWSRWIVGLRTAAALVLVSLLLQPACSRIHTVSSPPTLGIIVDSSASMAVIDSEMAAQHRLDEAIALGHIEPDVRDRSARDTLDALAAIRDAIPAILQVSRAESLRNEKAAQTAQQAIQPFIERLSAAQTDMADAASLNTYVEEILSI